MQMSSLELCNWLVISLLSFFVCGKDSDGCAAQRDLEQVVFASTALMLREVMPPPLQLMLE